MAAEEGGLEVINTSDGNATLDDKDTWAIFANPSREKVIGVELLGHREGDWRDTLQMGLRGNDLFIGLRSNYRIYESHVDGEQAYLTFTITKFDSTDNNQMRKDILNCLQAADPWARQTFNVDSEITPVKAANIVVNSQCFSNSVSQQKWQTDDVGFWSMGNYVGVAVNVVIPSGHLDADAAYNIYVKKFDEANFRGPRAVIYTDDKGRSATALPTIIEGDEILLKPRDYSAAPELRLHCAEVGRN